MAQLVYPTSDVTNEWASGGFADIAEGATPDDGDFANSSDAGDETFEVHIGDPTDPASSTGHIVRWRHALIDGGVLAADAGSGADITVSLVQGTTVRASKGPIALDAVLAWTEDSFTLSGAEADAIGTDYTDLRIRWFAEGGRGAPGNRRAAGVSWAEFEVPDASSETPQSIVATATGTPVFQIQVNKPLIATATGTPVLTKALSLGRILTATVTGTPILLKTVTKTITASAVGTAVLTTVKTVSQALAATAIGTALFVRTTSKTLTASGVGTAVLTKILSANRTIAAVAIGTAVCVKQVSKVLTATATGTPTLAGAATFLKALSASAVGTATLTANAIFAKLLTALATGTAVLGTVFTPGGGPAPVAFIGQTWRKWRDKRERKIRDHRKGGRR